MARKRLAHKGKRKFHSASRRFTQKKKGAG